MLRVNYGLLLVSQILLQILIHLKKISYMVGILYQFSNQMASVKKINSIGIKVLLMLRKVALADSRAVNSNLQCACVRAHTCKCGDFCAKGCGEIFKNKLVGACGCVRVHVGACGRPSQVRKCAARLHTLFFCKKNNFQYVIRNYFYFF